MPLAESSRAGRQDPVLVRSSSRVEAKLRSRAFGVYAVAWLLLLNAAVLLVGAWHGAIQAGLLVPLAGALEGLAPLLGIGAALLLTVVVAGFLALRRWAWIATMLLIGIALAHGIWLYRHGHPRYIHMVLNVVIVFYLNQRGVQEAFERRAPRGDGNAGGTGTRL